MSYFFGLDLGTGGIKSVLFDENGNEIGAEVKEYPTYQEHNGWMEQDPEDWYNAAVVTIRNVMEKTGVPAEEVLSIGFSGQMFGAVLLDGNNMPIRRAILWNDARTADSTADLKKTIGDDVFMKITCNPVRDYLTASKIHWVEMHEPDNFKRIEHIMVPKDYLRYRLCGEFAAEVSDASAMQTFDTPKRTWSEEMIDRLHLKMSQFGKMYESCDPVAPLIKDVAQRIGLTEKTIVVGGAGDNAAALVGSGCVVDGRVMTSIGTSGTILAYCNEPLTDPTGGVFTFCTSVPGGWQQMGLVNSAGYSVKWWRNNFFPTDEEYLEIDEACLRSGLGANALLYLPYLNGESTPCWDSSARGMFFGLSATHNKDDMTRAVMEGVTYALNDSIRVYKKIGVKMDEIRMCGGGSKAQIWRQMLADVYGMKVKVPAGNSENAAALGAAILAMVGAGTYKSVPEACDKLVKMRDEEVMPIPENTKAYEKYNDIYCKLYNATKELSDELAALR